MSETAAAADAPNKMKPRPTSPHLSVYRWQITMSMSILHRLTGVALAFGLLFLTWWVMAVLCGPDAYAVFIGFTKSILGRLFMIGWSWALMYHMLNGVRHLYWDIGKGYELQTVTQTGIVVIIGSFILTALIWLLAFTTAPQITGAVHG